MNKRITSIVLALLMVLLIIPVAASAGTGITSWEALQSAIDGASDGDTIKLTQDLKASSSDGPILINKDNDITLDLNGKTLDRGLKSAVEEGNVIIVDTSANVQIIDSVGGGKITGGNSSGNNGSDGQGGGIFINQCGSITLKNLTITGNKAYYGGGIGSQCSIEINDGMVISNNVGRAGGGIYAFTDQLTVKGGEIKNNDGPGIELGPWTNLLMTGGTISGNQSYWGGGIWCDSPAEDIVIGGSAVIYGNGNGEGLDSNFCNNFSGDTSRNPDGWMFTLTDYKDNFKVGLTPAVGKLTAKIANVSEDAYKHFSLDNDKTEMKYNTGNGYIEFIAHDFSFEANGNVLKATCSHADCKFHSSPLLLTLLPVEDKEYDGEIAFAEFDENQADKWEEVFTLRPYAKYEAIEGSIEDFYPVEVGKYKAFYTFEDYTLSVEFSITEASAPEYKIIEGAKSTWNLNEDENPTFRSDAPFDKFVCVEIDGEEIDPSNYTKSEGSTIITLKQAFAAKLAPGKHTINIVSTDGNAETIFYIEEEKLVPTNGENVETLISAVAILGIAAGSTVLYVKKNREDD